MLIKIEADLRRTIDMRYTEKTFGHQRCTISEDESYSHCKLFGENIGSLLLTFLVRIVPLKASETHISDCSFRAKIDNLALVDPHVAKSQFLKIWLKIYAAHLFIFPFRKKLMHILTVMGIESTIRDVVRDSNRPKDSWGEGTFQNASDYLNTPMPINEKMCLLDKGKKPLKA